MKKAFAMIVCLWTLIGICGCGANPPSENGKVSVDETETVQTNDMRQFTLMKAKQYPKKPGKIQTNPVRRMQKGRF